jgi:hypothetical protein
MLPNLKFLVCGILFCILLFAVTGAGVMLPDSRTHIGEMPEIGRPMMQQSMAEVPDRARAYMMMAARRSDELERLREPAPVENAPPAPELPNPEQSDPDLTNLPKPDAVATAASDGARLANPAPDGSPQAGGAMFIHVSPAPPAEIRSEEQRDDASPPRQVAVLTPAAAEESGTVPRFANVPLPIPRPAALGGLRRQGPIFHRRYRLAQPHDTTQGQAVPSQAGPMTPGVSTGNAVLSPR